MKVRSIFILVLVILASLIYSCKKNHYKVNVSSIRADIDIKRLEVDLFTLNPDEIAARLPDIKKKYKGFLKLFSRVINTGDINDPSFEIF